MTTRARYATLAGAAAVAAAGLVVGVTLATRTVLPARAAKPQPGAPRLWLDLGVRDDAEARDLRRASALYDAGERAEAARLFARYRSLQAQFGLAFAEWPRRAPAREGQLAADNPRSSFAQLHLGLALYWAGETLAAVAAWQRAATLQPDTASAVHADDLLHPRFAPGRPPFVPATAPPVALERLPPAQRLRALAARARTGGVHDKLLYGAALQALGHPLAAERQFAAAARLAPDDPEAQTAAAVGLFDKSRPATAFSKLGPLSRRFPRAATVRFHLGLMLLWLAQVREAREQLTKARALAPGSPVGKGAARFLERLRGIGTG